MIDGIGRVLESSKKEGIPELRETLDALLCPGGGTVARFVDQQRINGRVHRLSFEIDGRSRKLVVKGLSPALAVRNELVARRWLPMVGLARHAPPLLAVAAARSGACAWHVYEDLGGRVLPETEPDRASVVATVEVIAQLHARFADHPLLAECRLHGGDRGVHFFVSSLRDAIRCLEAVRPPDPRCNPRPAAIRDRMLTRLYRLDSERDERVQLMIESGGPETLLHGDCWRTNAILTDDGDHPHVRLIDWDHTAVGFMSYDLSNFLERFAARERTWILSLYEEALSRLGHRLPARPILASLFDTAESARLASRVIWPAMALANGDGEWGYESLATFDQWFEDYRPVLSTEVGQEAVV